MGSIYHLHQIVRPNFPIYAQLFELSKIHFRPNQFEPSIIGIGTEDQFDIVHFNKEVNDFPDILQVLPFTIVMPEDEDSENFRKLLEAELITKAHLNGKVIEDFNQAFDQKIMNMSIVTLADLNGLFASQLIQIGLEELWEIMQAVIFDQTEKLNRLGSGHIMYWKLDEVAFYVTHPSIYDEAMSDYVQDYETYALTAMRLEQLFQMHKIPYSKIEVMDPNFFKGEMSIDKARAQLSNHIKSL